MREPVFEDFNHVPLDQLANCHSAPLRYLVPLPMERFNRIPMEIVHVPYEPEPRAPEMLVYLTRECV